MSAAFALLRQIPLVWYLVLTLTGFAGLQTFEIKGLKTKAVQVSLAAERAAEKANGLARAREQVANKKLGELNAQIEIADKKRNAERVAVDNRLRELASSVRARSPAADACSRLEVAAVAVIPDATVEHLVELAADADKVADSLRACQSYVRDVAGAVVGD